MSFPERPTMTAENSINPAGTADGWPALKRWLPWGLAHLGILAALYTVLYCFGMVPLAPHAGNLNNWDAGWYQSVRDHGYVYEAGQQSNVAFFPLFAYFWRLTQLDALGISLVNALLGALGIAVLVVALPCSRRQGLLLASVPLLLFTLVPYSEALFYLLGAVLLAGLHRGRLAWVVLGLLGCCLTRTAATFFLPALLFAELITWLDSPAPAGRTAVRNVVAGGLTIALGVGAVLLLQYQQTGEWLGFVKTQRQWEHWWRYPYRLLYSTAGINMLWLDALSVGMACGAALSCVYLLGSRLWRRLAGRPGGQAVSKAVLFALVYCVCVGVFVVFQQGGDIANASRYVLATPFFAVLLWAAWQHAHQWPGWAVGLAVALLMGFLLGVPRRLDGFWPGQACCYWALLAGYAGLLVVAGSSRFLFRQQRELAGALYALNTLLQAQLLAWFLEGVWLG